MGIPDRSYSLTLQFRSFAAIMSVPDIHPQFSLSDGEALCLLKQAIFAWTEVSLTAKFIHEAIPIWSLSMNEGLFSYGLKEEDG
jgi:hypothetical protein